MKLKDTYITHDSDGEQILLDTSSSFAGLIRSSEVAGRGKLYIVILLLVQMVLGISSVFYALLLPLWWGRLPFRLCFVS